MYDEELTKAFIVYEHAPYPYWFKGKACLLGDAGEFGFFQ